MDDLLGESYNMNCSDYWIDAWWSRRQNLHSFIQTQSIYLWFEDSVRNSNLIISNLDLYKSNSVAKITKVINQCQSKRTY